MLITVVLAVNTSCSREMYDEKKAQEISDSVSPVDVDANHNWLLTRTNVVTVTASEGQNAQWVKILTADPLQDSDAEVAVQAPIEDGQSRHLSMTYPTRLTTLYAAIVDDEGRYTVTAFTPGTQQEVDFSDPLYQRQRLANTPQPQTFVYAFEEEMPDILSADYDYNDVVLHISHERTGEREVRFNVKLAAVGASKQDGACLHLRNFMYDDIESVTTVGNASFNVNHEKEVPDQMLVTHKKKDLLLKSIDNEAVVNLFCDAHWATGDALTENYGQIPRKKYNVTKGSSSNAVTMTPREITYIVTFKENTNLNYLNFDLLDPFIVEEYNGGIYEVHSFNLSNSPVLYSYGVPDLVKLPWSLVIPYSKFRHPLDGVNIGYSKYGISSFGAYGLYGHSFGEWASDHNSSASDWYLVQYATENRVF